MRIIDWSLSVRDIKKNKPRHILAFKFMSLLFWCFGSAEPHRYFIDCFVCSLLNIKLVFRYNQIVFPNSFPINVSINLLIFISIIKSVFSSIKIQIHFPLYFPLSYPINDRDVNCCFNVYSSREFVVCFCSS